MTILHAIILGIVEGLTEFLPVSSTGHLLLTNAMLGLQSKAADSYAIVIQLGAVLAVVGYYRVRLYESFSTAFKRNSSGQRLLINLFIGFLPAAVTGLLLEDLIENKLMRSDAWIAAALILGGVIMVVVDRWLRPRERIDSIDQIGPMDAFAVGVAQCFALWPGMSRSMSTIVGAQLRGFTNNTAADFSFLLALPTLGAATLYKLVTDHDSLLESGIGAANILIGLIVSFVVAWLAIAVFLKFLKRIGMVPFGIYRVVIGVVVFRVISTH